MKKRVGAALFVLLFAANLFAGVPAAFAADFDATNLSAGETYTEDISLDLMDIVVTDDNPTLTATLTLSNRNAGSLTTATSGVITSTYSPSTGIWLASGPVADVNVLLAGVTFVPVSNFNSSFTITTNIDDGINPPLTGSKTISGIAVNDAPVLDPSRTPFMAAVTQRGPLPVGVVGNSVTNLVDFVPPVGALDNVSDNDAGASLGVAIVAVDPALNCYFTTDGGMTWASIGAVSNTSSRLLAATGSDRLYCRSDSAGVFPAALTFRAWDRTSGVDGGVSDASSNGGAFAFSSAQDTVPLTVHPAPDVAPTATHLSVAERYSYNTSLNLTDVVVSDEDNSSTTSTFTLSDPAAGRLTTSTSGFVTSTYDADHGVWTASGLIEDVNALLAATTFVPAVNYHTDFTIATAVSDGTLSVTGTKAVTFTRIAPETPGDLVVAPVAWNEIDLSWSAPAFDGGLSITGYRIERALAGEGFADVVSDTGATSTRYSDTGLMSDTRYTYRVSAINSTGTSLTSDTSTARTLSHDLGCGALPASGPTFVPVFVPVPSPAPVVATTGAVPLASSQTPLAVHSSMQTVQPPVFRDVFTFTRTLKMGMRGADVVRLQAFLNHQGFLVGAFTAGGSRKETGYFGIQTKKALARFQAAHGLAPASGYFGPLTRKIVNEMYP